MPSNQSPEYWDGKCEPPCLVYECICLCLFSYDLTSCLLVSLSLFPFCIASCTLASKHISLCLCNSVYVSLFVSPCLVLTCVYLSVFPCFLTSCFPLPLQCTLSLLPSISSPPAFLLTLQPPKPLPPSPAQQAFCPPGPQRLVLSSLGT